MLLCDSIGRVAALAATPEKLGLPRSAVLQSTALRSTFHHINECHKVLTQGTRYVLDRDVVTAATDVLLSRPSSIRDCLSILRVPWPVAWFEWLEEHRYTARSNLGLVHDNGKEVPHRIGFLITADETGRRGEIQFFWSHMEGEQPFPLPAVSPLLMRFDFDDWADEGLKIPEELKKESNLYQKYASNPKEVEAIEQIDRTVSLKTSKHGAVFALSFAEESGSQREAEGAATAILENAKNDLSGESLSVLAMLMLITSRNGTVGVAEDRGKLNKARVKRGEPPLFDHVNLRLRLNAADRHAATQAGRSGSGDRAAPRAHMVSGHFVNRKSVIYWRRAHMRGAGGRPQATTRTVHVSL